jgi:hypothetical protein
MIPHPDSMIFLVDIYHRETQAEAARMRQVREAYGDGLRVHTVVAAARHQLGAMLVYARQRLGLIRWTLTLHRSGAFPR